MDTEDEMIIWKKIPFNEEKAEFFRVASDFTTESGQDILLKNVKDLERLYNIARLEQLSNNLWKNMENTDSWDVRTIVDIQKAIRDNVRSSGARNIEEGIKEFLTGVVRAPVVLEYENGKKRTLIAGNTRLMLAKVLDIRPSVVLIKSDW